MDSFLWSSPGWPQPTPASGATGSVFLQLAYPLLLRTCFFRDLDMPDEIPDLIFRSGGCLVLSPLCSVPLIQVLFRFSVYFIRGDLSFLLSKFSRDDLLQSPNIQPSLTVDTLRLFSRLWNRLHTGLLCTKGLQPVLYSKRFQGLRLAFKLDRIKVGMYAVGIECGSVSLLL